MKKFVGRVIAAGEYQGEAVVTHEGFNTLASCQTSALLATSKKIIVSDQNNKELYKKNITGKALCLPETIGSTTGGMVLYSACALDKQPACMLFSKTIDSLAASGAILAANWTEANMPVVDELGQEFLDYVKDGMMITIAEDGLVTVEG